MQLELGQRIRKLRQRDGRTQEALAEAIGVTSQAVSRWESNGGYPDIEMIPSIANYFGITIDELFGYNNDRDKKITAIIQKIEKYDIKHSNDGAWVEECIAILRNGLAEFPNNEQLLITLTDTLWEAGWRRHHGWLYYDDEGFIQYHYDTHKKNEYWAECIKVCEYLVESTKDNSVFTQAIAILVPLHRNYGEFDKAIAYAKRMPKLQQSQEFLLTEATDGKLSSEYIGEFLLECARQFSEQLVYALIADIRNFDTDMPIEKIKGAIAVFDLICDDGNMGIHHDFISKLYLYLSRLQWERKYHDDAFASLYKALDHARAFENLFDEKEHRLTAPLVSHVKYDIKEKREIVKSLPEDWPFWCNPDFTNIKSEIQDDPRWGEWLAKINE
ncbi:MAG: helix-turn-helix transcriptional regulator [Clostridia bacterium]|nr:helix-turn-helix transcriptional regulator [Clostridia bacterium]